jgi:IMP dehydrogenase/GMP reductase
VIAGNVATPEAVIDLENWGADATKVGVGPGKVCITKLKTGFGTGGWQLSALKWCARVATKPIIADGGIRSHGDIAKSIRFGATMVMIGSLFAGHEESPGKTVEVDGELFKEYYGSASDFNKGEYKHVEGKRILEPIKGKLADTLIEMEQDVQSSISYAGGTKLMDIRKVNYVILGGDNAGEHLLMYREAPDHARRSHGRQLPLGDGTRPQPVNRQHAVATAQAGCRRRAARLHIAHPQLRLRNVRPDQRVAVAGAGPLGVQLLEGLRPLRVAVAVQRQVQHRAEIGIEIGRGGQRRAQRLVPEVLVLHVGLQPGALVRVAAFCRAAGGWYIRWHHDGNDRARARAGHDRGHGVGHRGVRQRCGWRRHIAAAAAAAATAGRQQAEQAAQGKRRQAPHHQAQSFSKRSASWCSRWSGLTSASSTLKWLRPGSASHTGTTRGPQASRINSLWRRNSALSSPPAVV